MFARRACVLQSSDNDCGAAALATVALAHRGRVPLRRLRALARTGRDGTSLRELAEAAAEIGLEPRGVGCAPSELRSLPLPAIAQVRRADGSGHFVVLYRAGRRAVTIADPASGLERQTLAAFAERWSGVLLLLAPRPGFGKAGDTTAPSPMRRFLSLLASQRALLVEAAFCGLLMALLCFAGSFGLQCLVDSVLGQGDRALLGGLAVGMALAIAFREVFALLRQYLLAHAGRRLDLELFGRYLGHVLRLPLGFLATRKSGDILARLGGAARLRDAVAQVALAALGDGPLLLASAAVLCLQDPVLALVGWAAVPILLLVALIHQRPTRGASRRLLEASSELSSHFVESVCGLETIKACGAEAQRREEAETRLVGMAQAGFAIEKLGMSIQGWTSIASELAGIVVLGVGGLRVMDGAMSVGQLLFFHAVLGALLAPLGRLAALNHGVQEALAALERLDEVLEEPAERVESFARGGVGGGAEFSALRQGIALRGLSFAYDGRGKALDGLELWIPAGKTVAIVGESGSGKSTLLRLLQRFHDPQEGRILVDGIDLRDIGLASWRAGLGVVSQEPFLFSGTIRDNLAFGVEDAASGAVAAAARAAGLETFIDGLPERYDTPLGERGLGLSGGQRQRLAIARALLRRPEILLFDEATSHLDTATERAIQESLRSSLRGKTAVIVAHRLSTIREADLIYVLEDGRVIASGSHWELLEQNGPYAALWRAQLGGEPGATAASRGLEAA